MSLFLTVRTSFGWPREKLPTTDGRCRQNTHSHDTFVHVQVIRTLPAQMFHSPREHAWLKGQHDSGLRIVVSSKRSRHTSVMSHMLPHLSQNTSTRSLSPTSPIFRPSSPSLSCPLALDQETLRDSRRSGGSTKSAPPTRRGGQAKHEYEELKEGAWLEPGLQLSCERK